MKKAELTKGMHVAIARGRDWESAGVDEAIVLDADMLYEEPYYRRSGEKQIGFVDPRYPDGGLVFVPAIPRGKQLAVLHGKPSWSFGQKGDVQWEAKLVGLNQIVGPYEECKKVVDERNAEAREARAQKVAARDARTVEWERLKDDHLLLNSGVSFDADTGRVTMTIGRLKDLLEGRS